MKKTCLVLMLSIVLFSCGNKEKNTDAENNETLEEIKDIDEIDPNDMPVLLGKQEINAIKSPPYSKWFIEGYRYALDQKKLGPLKTALEGKTITVFMGTWCEDSRTQVPPLLAILDAISYDNSKITLITVSRDKDTPEGYEDDLNILYVPTIILYDGESEMGRIVEYPVESLEADLLKIATGEEYKHSYENEQE